ncbi:putative membrane protein [Sedimentisphaera cyanobacteriorum]|uniref:Putative membrane protein n=1 Tax=Sedimentisphaera cyanobacteriorum TaxID=1940790 RepID=A0A1Q2HSQ4_9BACT|nr:acyltransferase [Sedimentisphaera cyanobacteriorum]AQQ10361.1 putative membrane protein [Sedimentisphaera cyanobacteriorum]
MGRLKYIDCARALAILLVMLEHAIGVTEYFGWPLMITSKGFAAFHMPVFFTAAGFMLALGGREKFSLDNYLSFEKKKFLRLIVPLFVITAITFAGELAIGQSSLKETGSVFYKMIFYPLSSPAGHGWFLITLMNIFLIFPLVISLFDKSKLVLIAVFAVCIMPASLPKHDYAYFLELERTRWYLLFVLFGYYVFGRLNITRHGNMLGALSFLAIAAGGSMQVIEWESLGQSWFIRSALRLIKLVFCFAGMLGMFYLSSCIANRAGMIKAFFSKLGRFSYDVYLYHLIAGMFCGVILSRAGISEEYSWLMLIIIYAVSGIGSFVFGQIIRKSRLISKIMLGS